MKIESSAIQMNSHHVEATIGQTSKTTEEGFISIVRNFSPVKPSTQSFPGMQPYRSVPVSSIPRYRPIKPMQDFRQKIFHYLVEQMRDLLDGNNFRTFNDRSSFLSYDSGPTEQTVWRKQVTESSLHGEYERTTFQTEGLVKTSDGRTLPFQLSMEMSRSFVEETKLSSVVENDVIAMKDPLILNLDLPVQVVEDQHFYFDLDCDGNLDKVPVLAGNSGFLALDKNGDGTINDGSELFGAESGNGFDDLAQYDKDGNGWIDENDEVYSRLKIWMRSGDGKERLLSLKEADVGAIFLGSLKTSMQLKNSTTNESYGTIQRTGIYLHESTGQAGTVQHVDFAI